MDSYNLPQMWDGIDNLDSANDATVLDLLDSGESRWHSESQAILDLSAADFQRLLNIIRLVINCNSGLDDLIVYSVTWKEHVQTQSLVPCFPYSHKK